MTEQIPQRPKWLDDDFLRTSIRKSKSLDNDSHIQIHDLALSYVVAKGENYMSVMYRAFVTFQLEKGPVLKEPFVVKVSHDVADLSRASSLLCDVENDMFINILPAFSKLYEEKGLKTQLSCRFFHAIDEPKVLVLEDLKLSGFVMANKHIGTDMAHTKLVYTKMAQFHAAGINYFYTQPDAKDKYAKSGFEILMEEQPKGMVGGQKNNVNGCIKELEKHGNKYAKAIDFLQKYCDLLDTNGLPMTPTVPGCKFNGMIHTDLHINNVMFKYKQDGTVDDMILVDFQTVYYASVLSDFLFYFITSANLELRKNNYEDLKTFYFDALVDNLKLLNHQGGIPTRQEFEEELKLHTMTALFAGVFMLKNVVRKLDEKSKSREKSEAFSMEDLQKLMASEAEDRNYLDKLVAIIDILQRDGFMDKHPKELCK